MKQILSIALVLGVITVGCSKEEEELPAAAPVTGGASVTADPLANPAAGGATTATPEPFDPSKVGPPPPPMIDFAAAEKPVGNFGEEFKDHLEMLNHILFNYNEGRGTYSTDVIPTFKNEAEQRAYDEALRKLKEPITDLNELVKAKVIKAIPAAPAGKKYAVNKKTLKVELVDANAPAQP